MNNECVDVSIASAGGVVEVRLRGEMDAHSSPALQRSLKHLLDPRMRLTIDLSGVTFIDSRGLQVLFLETARFREHGGRLEIANVSLFVHRVIGYAGLTEALHLADDNVLRAS
jgi:anti-anti-sigma factor